MLRIDSREDKKMIRKVRKLAKEKNIDYEITELTVGDYIWDDYLVIERKTIPDFINSIRNGHLETQLLDMEQFTHSFLLISGRFENVTYIPFIKNWTVTHTVGALCSISARYDVKVIQLANDSQVAKAIFKLKEKVDKGKKCEAVKRHTKTLNVISPSFSLYLAIPGIGPQTAKKLIKIYPNFLGFLQVYKDGELEINLRKEAKQFLDGLLGK